MAAGAGAEQGQSGELNYWWQPRGEDRVFDLAGWPPESLQVARSMLNASEVAHRWEGPDKFVVAASLREEVASVLDEVIAASQPHLEAEEDRVVYELAEWPRREVDELQLALDREGIVHEWSEEGDLLVYEADEERVDDLFDELGLRGPDDGRVHLEGEELTALLNNVYLATDRLARNPEDANAVIEAVSSSVEMEQVVAPPGFEEGAWERLVEQLRGLRGLLEANEPASDEEVSGRAREVRDRLRQWL